MRKTRNKNNIAIILGILTFAGICIQIAARDNFGFIITWLGKAFYPTTITIENAANITLNEHNAVLVTDKGNRRIVKIENNGTYTTVLKAGNDTFNWAADSDIDHDGTILINDQILGGDGMTVVEERILRIDPLTGKRTILISFSYPSDGVPFHLARLYGPFITENSCYAIKTHNTGFTLIELGAKNTNLLEINFPQAEYSISSFNTNGNYIWFIYKGGIIYRADSSGKYTPVYNGENENTYSVPWKLARAHIGALYFSDIGERNIKRIENGEVHEIFRRGEAGSDELSFAEMPIYYAVAANEAGCAATVALDSVMLKARDGSQFYATETFKLEENTMRVRTFAVIIISVLSLISLALIIRLIIIIIRKIRWKTDMILVSAITSIVIATLIIVLPSTYSEGMQSYIDNTFIQLSALAQAGGYQIDAAALEKINLPRDYMSDEYIRLWNSLRGLINEEYEWNKSIYCVLYRYVDGVLWTPIFMDGTGGAYYPYDYFPESLEQVFLKGETERVDADIAADGEWMYIHSPVYNREQKIVGALEVGLNLTAFQSNYKRIYLSIVFAVIAASVVLQIIVMQIIKAIDYLDERKRSLLSLKEKDAAGGNSKSITLNYEPVEFVNPTVFLLYFAFNMVTAFLPMYSAALYEPLSRNSLFSAFPREFMEAFPISAHLAAVGIGCAAAGTIVRKIGFRTTTGIGGFLMLVSCILLGFTSKYIIFTIFFFFMGLGFGLMTNAISGSIAAIPNEAKRSLGFTYYNSSLFSGFCCGTVIGAALAESLGGREVFLVSAAATLFPVIVLCILLKDPVNKRLIEEHTTVSLGQTMRRSILSFLLKPDVFLFFLFSLIPYTLAGYFMFYFMPRFAEENLGLSPSVIGQLFLVHGIAVLVFSTALTKWTAKYFTSNAICLSFVLIAAAFLIFGLNPSLHTLIIALFLLGVGSSFGAASLSNYYVNLNSVHTYGYEKSMSVYQTVENSGDTLAPIIFGYALSGSLQQNFILFTLILIVLLLVLAIALKRRPEYSDILSK